MTLVLERYSNTASYEDSGVGFIWSSAGNGRPFYADTIHFETKYDRTSGRLRLEYWRGDATVGEAPHRVLFLDDGEDFDGSDLEFSGRNTVYGQAGVSVGLSRTVPLLLHGINPWKACPIARGSENSQRETVGKADTTKTLVQGPPCESVFAWIDEREHTIRKLSIRRVAEVPAIREHLASLRSRRPDLSEEINDRISATTVSEVTEIVFIFDARLDGGHTARSAPANH